MPYNDSPFPLLPVHLIESQSVGVLCLLNFSAMAPEVGKPRITEVQVRMDCNGCVQKIKRALHSVTGIYELYIDFPQQKITILGSADPEKIVKAIKKTRKSAVICSHTEPPDIPAQPAEQASESGAPEADSTSPSPTEAAPLAEPPKDPAQLPPENPPQESSPQETKPLPEEKPSPSTADTAASQPEPPKTKDVEEVHVIHHYRPDYGYRQHCGQNSSYGHSYAGSSTTYPVGPAFRPQPPPPLYATHNYNTHRPSPYVTQYEYIRPPPQYTHYSRPVPYSEDFYDYGNNNGNITSVFSDENPNACTIA